MCMITSTHHTLVQGDSGDIGDVGVSGDDGILVSE